MLAPDWPRANDISGVGNRGPVDKKDRGLMGNRKSRGLRWETADQWEKRIVGSRWVKTADQLEKRIVGSRWVKTAEKTRAQKSKVQVGEEGVVLLKNNTNKKKINFYLFVFFTRTFS